LVRKICEQCKKPTELSAELQKTLTASITPERLKEILVSSGAIKDTHEPFHANWQTSTGCDQCSQDGFLGRMGIYEVFYVTEEFRQAIRQDASETDLLALAKKSGMRSMLEDGIVKAALGLTTIEEVLRVTKET